MAIQTFTGRIRQRFSTLAVIEAVNPILLEGEVWIEKDEATGYSTGRRKVGDGQVSGDVITGTAFVDLPFEPAVGGIGTGDVVNLKTGVKGNGTNKHIDTGYTQSSFAQNDMHSFAYLTELPTSNLMRVFGNGGTGGGAWSISINAGTGNCAARCRNVTADAGTGATPGGFGMNRSTGPNYQRMFGDSVATVTRASSAINASPYYLLASSGNASSTANGHSDARCLVWAIGPATTLANYITPTSDLVAALNAI